MEGSESVKIYHSGDFGRLKNSVDRAARFFLNELGIKKLGVNVYLLTGVEMRSVNRRSRGKDKSTNVISINSPRNFPVVGADAQELGEVYLCPPYIERKKEDLYYMLLHGLLHLLGFNHENKSDRMRMQKIEVDLILKWRSHKS